MEVEKFGENLEVEQCLEVEKFGENLEVEQCLEVEKFGENLEVEKFGENLEVEKFGENLEVENFGENLEVEKFGENLEFEKFGENLLKNFEKIDFGKKRRLVYYVIRKDQKLLQIVQTDKKLVDTCKCNVGVGQFRTEFFGLLKLTWFLRTPLGWVPPKFTGASMWKSGIDLLFFSLYVPHTLFNCLIVTVNWRKV